MNPTRDFNDDRLRVIATLCDVLLRDPSAVVRLEAVKALEKIDPMHPMAIAALLQAAQQDTNGKVRRVIVKLLGRIYIKQQTLDTPLVELLTNQLKQLNQTLNVMSDQPKVQMNFNAPVTGVAGNVEGDFVVNVPEQGTAEAIADLQTLFNTLQQTHPTATETEAPIILKAELEAIEQTDPQRWAMLRKDLLNRERWFQGGKAALTKMVEHFADNNVFAKGGIAFLEEFSKEPK
ncbi:HEAT repeat domain-containing protein [Oscillatoria sp. FACHB-1407]|uniref:HEAT repeat domain-containing protein n=1 Tax=Oscillatoria sp. FACHB-1407 TaxID=2692847 RepID=UPI001685D332|nr:HEAT repeat domain-containing protein [Oscillatoria sp. FACHB-1407]MBD2464028.1 HEAT repeat domain-containing protein [Oscillatoria sp. FACHB-1407]